jgi:hypothetical protein
VCHKGTAKLGFGRRVDGSALLAIIIQRSALGSRSLLPVRLQLTIETIVFPGLSLYTEVREVKAARHLFREPPNAVGNRQPDHDHVHNQPWNQVVQLVRPSCVKRGERQDDQIHYLFNRGAEEQATHQHVLLHETQSAAGRVVISASSKKPPGALHRLGDLTSVPGAHFIWNIVCVRERAHGTGRLDERSRSSSLHTWTRFTDSSLGSHCDLPKTGRQGEFCYPACGVRHRGNKIHSYDVIPEIFELLKERGTMRTGAVKDEMVTVADRKKLVYNDDAVTRALSHSQMAQSSDERGARILVRDARGFRVFENHGCPSTEARRAALQKIVVTARVVGWGHRDINGRMRHQ